MNKEQIQKGETRVFPFYKDRYLGVTPLGYSNEKAARKFMRNVPAKDVDEYVYGSVDGYVYEHGELAALEDNPKEFKIDGGATASAKSYDYSDMTPIRELFVREAFDAARKRYPLVFKEGYVGMKGSEEKLRQLLGFESEFGKYPEIFGLHFTSDEWRRRAYSKFVTDKVDFRRGTLVPNVLWEDGTVTKAPTYDGPETAPNAEK